MSVSLQTRQINRCTYFVDNRTKRLYYVLGFKRNRTVVILENCKSLIETEIRLDRFNDKFSEGVRIIK